MDVYIDERDLAGEKTLKQALTELTGRWKNFLSEEHTTVEYFTLSSTCTIRVRNVYSIMIVEG